MPIYPFLHEFSVAYRHSVFSAVLRHSVFSGVRRHSVFSGIHTFCLQHCTEAFCLDNMSSCTDSNLHMPIYPFLHEFSVAYRHSVFSAVRMHSVLTIYLQAQTVTYTCLFTLSFMNFQCHTDILSSALYGGILSWEYVFRHRQ